MDTLGQIGSIASLGSLILSRPAELRRGAQAYPVRVMTKRSQLPYRAEENGRPYDTQLRLDRATSPVEPFQNDLVVYDGQEWIVWRIIPSAAGSHWVLECMAPPTVAVVPVQKTKSSDGMGGSTFVWTEFTDALFHAKVREASTARQLAAETVSAIGRLHMAYPASVAPADFGTSWRVVVEGRGYEILSITTDDENPAWHNAILTREGTE